MKVLLVSIYHNENMGIRLLQPILRNHHHECALLFFKTAENNKFVKNTLIHAIAEKISAQTPPEPSDYKKFQEFIVSYQPDIIGFGVMSAYYLIAAELTRKAREVSDAPVVWGGIHATIAPEECLEYADYAAMGESVETFPQFVDNFHKIEAGEDAPGFAYIREGNMVVQPGPKPYKDLDQLPFIDFSNKDKYYIHDGKIFKHGDAWFFPGGVDAPYKLYHTIMTSWGCPFRCNYCVNSLERMRTRRRSVDSVIAELKMVKAANPNLRMICFWDDIFTMNLKWCKEFAEKYKEKISLPFWCYTHPKVSNPEVLESLRNAGMMFVVMGIQSGNDQTRKVMGRLESDQDVMKTATELAKLRNIPYGNFGKSMLILYDIIIDNPREAQKEMLLTLDLLRKMPRNYYLNIYTLNYFPKYPLTESYLKEKLIKPEDVEGKHKRTDDEIKQIYASFHSREVSEAKKRHDYFYICFSISQYKYVPEWLFRQMVKGEFWFNKTRILFKLARVLRWVSLLLTFPMQFRIGTLYWHSPSIDERNATKKEMERFGDNTRPIIPFETCMENEKKAV